MAANDVQQSNMIQITPEEAGSEHVDDLLRRQASLRGERGIAANRKRKWYYQSWFILMIAGVLAAVCAWALIEPFFDDMEYIQGTVVAVEPEEEAPNIFGVGSETITLNFRGKGWVDVRGEKVWFTTNSWEVKPDGSRVPLDLKTVKQGQLVGVHMESVALGTEHVNVGQFLETSPKPSNRAQTMSISQISSQNTAASLLLFPLVAGLVGLGIGAADGIVCRLPRRALISGAVGFLVGFIGGFLAGFLAGLVYMPLNALAVGQMGESGKFTTFGFIVQMTGRGLAWMLAGTAMGLGQGLALRSKRLLMYGFLGGIIGGLLGGLLFDPLDLLLLGRDKPSAHMARMIGLGTIGAAVGVMIGVVELLARDVWLRMVEGPLAGKEFVLFKDVMTIGAGPKSEIYLFNDPQVAQRHAILRAVGDQTEIEACSSTAAVLVNQRPVSRARLRHGDVITIGRTVFTLQKRQG